MALNSPGTFLQTTIAGVAAISVAAVIATVLGFEHIGGYIPCALCLEQRLPYYAALPVAAAAFVAGFRNGPFYLTRGLLAITGLLMLYAMALGIRHAGVEWDWWQGPTDCGAVGGDLTLQADSLFDSLDDTRPPSCDEAAGRFLGLSFAGWNVVASAMIAAIAFYGALKSPPGSRA